MSMTFKQKLKLLYIMKYLYEKTDERHPAGAQDMMAYLADFDIVVNRKTVYDDIDVLRNFGMDIVYQKADPRGYYLAKREFEFGELKLLVDIVQSSTFITKQKSKELIQKLEGLVSVHDARALLRQAHISAGTKTENEDVYENIEKIHKALSKNRQITFQYSEWTLEKKLQLKKNGELYQVSPWELLWNEEHYYMIGIDEKSGIVKHYRVDKVSNLTIGEQRRTGSEIFEKFDSAVFAAKTFGMFGGIEEAVRIEFENKFVGVVLEHFGEDVILHKIDQDHFSVLVHISVSNQFFGWLSGLGSGTKIVSPEKVKKEYVRFLKKALAVYKVD